MEELLRNHEDAPVKTRNEQLREMVRNGIQPVLLLELEALKREFEMLVAQQEENGKLLGEAMSESSETWHDNAPADIINGLSVGLSDKATGVIDRLRRAVVVEYPSADENEVTLGSLVHLSFGGDTPEPMLLMAITPRMPEEYAGHVPDDCEVVTMTSPLGVHLIGAVAGQEIIYEVNNRPLRVTVVGVSHPTPNAVIAM